MQAAAAHNPRRVAERVADLRNEAHDRRRAAERQARWRWPDWLIELVPRPNLPPGVLLGVMLIAFGVFCIFGFARTRHQGSAASLTIIYVANVFEQLRELIMVMADPHRELPDDAPTGRVWPKAAR